MSFGAQQILHGFDLLPEPDKREVAIEILRRLLTIDLPSLSDYDLVMNAESIFLELDRRENGDENAESRGDLAG